MPLGAEFAIYLQSNSVSAFKGEFAKIKICSALSHYFLQSSNTIIHGIQNLSPPNLHFFGYLLSFGNQLSPIILNNYKE